jgi:hypothetical protein
VISTGVTSTGGATSSGSTSTGGQSSSESTSTGGQSSLESTSTGGQSSLESTSTGGQSSSESTSTGGQSSSESTSTGGQSSSESTSTGGQSSLESTSTGGQSSLESTSTGGQSSSESTSSETSSADNGGADKSKGVSGAPAAPVVQLISMPKQDLSGVIMVTVTEKTFSFSLPENLQSQIVNTGSTVKISMADGGSLPGWLKYNAETKTFAAKNAPNNGKPVNVVVIIDNVKWTISINNLVTQ